MPGGSSWGARDCFGSILGAFGEHFGIMLRAFGCLLGRFCCECKRLAAWLPPWIANLVETARSAVEDQNVDKAQNPELQNPELQHT